MIRVAVTLCFLGLTGSAWADPPLTPQQHFTRGFRWHTATQYEKAIEEFEQGYLIDGTPSFLLYMADSYDRWSSLATTSADQILASKQRALELYKAFINKAPSEEFGRDVARGRIEPLRQEIKDLAAQAASRTDKLDQILAELRALREVFLRRQCGERAATALAR